MNKKIFIIVVFLVVVGGGFFCYRETNTEVAIDTEKEETYLTYQNKEGNFSIQYRTSPDGYVSVPARREDPSLPIITILYKETDYQKLIKSTEPREGPPGIAILVFPNVSEKGILEWIKNHNESNYQLIIGKEEMKKVGTVDVVIYDIDGLYRSHAVAAIHNNSAILIFGGYQEPGDSYEKDFKSFIETLTFF
jgi:hypothetical protein